MAIPIPLRKSTDCSYYLQGNCKKGDAECEFRHNPLALSPAVKDCAFWFNGRCTKGPACPFRHLAQNYGAYGMSRAPPVDPSTVPCVFYAQGKCMKGDACPYSHSVTLSAPAAVVNAVEETGLIEAEEGEVQVDAPVERDAAAYGSRRQMTWRQTQEPAPTPSQENMVLQFDEEDEEADAAPGSDRRRSTPGKARRGPLWEVRSTIGRSGEAVRSVSRPEPITRQIVGPGLGFREEQFAELGERRIVSGGSGRQEQRGRGRHGGGRQEETGDRGVLRRVVASTGPSVKDRLGGGVNQGSQGSQLRVQARVDPQDSQRERMVEDLQRGLLAKGADRWGRQKAQGETLSSRPDTQRAERGVEAQGGAENGGQPRKFGAEARRRWLELQKEKGVVAEDKASDSDGPRSRLRDLVELERPGARRQERGVSDRKTGGSDRMEGGADKKEAGSDKKEGPRILTLAEIRAAKKRSREAEEAGQATGEETAGREGKRPAPVRLNRAGLSASQKEEGSTGDGATEAAPESAEEEGAAAVVEDTESTRLGVKEEDVNGAQDEEAVMGETDHEAQEGDDGADGEVEGEEYEDEDGEDEDGEDDIANLMKKYGDVLED